MVVNSNGFLQRWARRTLTPDLAVTEFWSWWSQSSRAGGHGVLELVQTDGPGFSLCAAPLESSGPGFHGVEQRLGEQVEVWMYTRSEMSERTCREQGKELR